MLSLLDPVILFFILGAFGSLVKSDLRIPEAFYHTLSMYLLLSIGIKGGIELYHHPLADLLKPAGGVAASWFKDLRKVGPFLLAFGVTMPILSALPGITIGVLTGLSLGGTLLLATMAASASYIAAPATVRIAIPEANPTYYLTLALGITFPFNIVLGIPLYHWLTAHSFPVSRVWFF
jgi:hypothetical protein